MPSDRSQSCRNAPKPLTAPPAMLQHQQPRQRAGGTPAALPPGSKAAECSRQTHGRLKNENSERLSVPGQAATRQLESTAQSQPCPWSPHRPAFLEAFA